MNINKITLENCLGKVSDERIKTIQSPVGVRLPKSFIEIVRGCDGGTPIACDFEYTDQFKKSKRIDCIGAFLNLNPNEYGDFLSTFLNSPEFLPEGLIAFAENGGGDYICFDYRQDKNNPDPPVIYWNHEADVGKEVSFVTKNFEEFLGMLKEPEN